LKPTTGKVFENQNYITMTHSKEVASAIKDLILINHDRIEGYQKAIEMLDDKDVDLKTLFIKMISNSQRHLSELDQIVYQFGEDVEDGTTTSGKIFRTWMSIKSAFSSDDRMSTLESCVTGEDAALKAYDLALVSDADMSPKFRQTLMEHRASIKSDQNQIKDLRNLHQQSH
jgi:uncharacterized protein (TIGR02284 family)